MKKTKNGMFYRTVAFALIAVVLLFCVAAAANSKTDVPKPESGETDINSGKTDENTDGTQGDASADREPPAPKIPEYIEPLTGLETEAGTIGKKAVAVCMDPSAPLYGVSSSLLTVEYPVENGKTGMLCFYRDIKKLGKLGSLRSAGGVSGEMALRLNSLLVCKGTADLSDTPGRNLLDLSASEGYSYTENSVYCYSNGDLLHAAFANTGMNVSTLNDPELPFRFPEFGAEPMKFSDPASAVTMPFSDFETIGYSYLPEEDLYYAARNGNAQTDLLNGHSVKYTNIVTLFTDTITYENEDSTRMTLVTSAGGSGFAFTGGTYCPITWSIGPDGKLMFRTENGLPLVLNRGTTDIAFFKSAKKNALNVR